jgi:hypothetical protein
MEIRNIIKRILREETELPHFIRRRVSRSELEEMIYIINNYVDDGYDPEDLIYEMVRELLASESFQSLIDDSGNENQYWESYIKVEKPLVDYLKKNIKK